MSNSELSLGAVRAEMLQLGIRMSGVAGGVMLITMFNCLVKRLYTWSDFSIRIAFEAVCSQYFFGVTVSEAWDSVIKTLNDAGIKSASALYEVLRRAFERD